MTIIEEGPITLRGLWYFHYNLVTDLEVDETIYQSSIELVKQMRKI